MFLRQTQRNYRGCNEGIISIFILTFVNRKYRSLFYSSLRIFNAVDFLHFDKNEKIISLEPSLIQYEIIR